MTNKTKIIGLATSVLTLSVFSANSASAQVDQKPYILFVMDTSGSTEWTPEGDEQYPKLPTTDPNYQPEWVPGTPMKLGTNSSGAIVGDPAEGPERFGPCFVWEPNSCNAYRRPPWTNRYADWQDIFGSQALMTARKDLMMGVSTGSTHDGIRLRDDSQPRHVMLKEVLTGEMILGTVNNQDYSTMSPVNDGPGCWFVPRQRDATIQGLEDQKYCAGEDRFEDLPDYDEPRPHFQEVFDAQLPNGVLDKLADQAIFGVALLDGYREDVGNGWPEKLNDSVDGSSKIDGTNPSQDSFGNGEDDSSNYNLGVYRIVGPKTLDLPPQFLSQLSSHVQMTIVEAGFLREDNKAGKIDVKNGISSLGLAYDKNAHKLIQDDYEMAKHPIARATPLAAAIMDVHQFFGNDDRFKQGDSGSKDPYAECRPKQVVLISDGYPEPERPGGSSGSNIGSDALTPAFGYDPLKYPYDATEDEISSLTSDSSLYGPQANAAQRFGPRVHVVALSVANDASTRTAILDKLSSMAEQGKTCAEFFLPDHVPDATDPTGASGNCLAGCSGYIGGVCQSLCLMGPQKSYPYTSTGVNPVTMTCNYPALILNSNNREAMEKALLSVTSGIIGGPETITRTKAAVSNFLDDNDFSAGGQYRTYSGVQMLGAYWRGILNREVIPCETTGAISFAAGSDTADQATAGIKTADLGVRAIHADIGDQVNCGSGTEGGCATSPPTDNRRIFTSLPTDEIFSYPGRNGTSLDLGGRIFFRWKPITVDNEEFRESSFPNSSSPAPFLVGSRIPFRAAQIHEAIGNANSAGWTEDDTATFLNAKDFTEFKDIVRNQRGQTPSKGTNVRATSRVFSGILNSDPVVVPPPILDLPIESYRAFRAFYGDRPTMLYSATVDGQLHAIHMGDLKNQISVRTATSDNTWTDQVEPSLGAEVSQSQRGQREAWAYIPSFLLRQLAYNTESQGYLMDGPTVVRDVRLCQAKAEDSHNQNLQACQAIATTGVLTAEQQWRTVLVQAMGRAGAGYFAMDVTRTGGLRPGAASRTINRPDPALLWEFDRTWEITQVKVLGDRDPDLVFPPTSLMLQFSNPGNACGNPPVPLDFWRSPAMGLSISAPEIATLAVDLGPTGGVQQRPVAVFTAGATDENVDGCGAGLQGSAIYVIDLQTGTLLRRFVTYFDGTTTQTFAKNKDNTFEARFGRIELTGSPALYDASTGSLASRGFVGDSIGRLYRMNFQNPDPAAWTVDLFFDPYASAPLQTAADSAIGANANFGPAAFKPAISRGPNRQLVVTYGLGDTSDSPTPDLAQAVITIAESDGSVPHEVRWYTVLEKGEKLMGEPLVFNGVTYFPTYHVPDGDACQPGRARVWGVDYFAATGSSGPIGTFDFNDPDFSGGETTLSPGASATVPALWFSPRQSTLIRGLTLTLGPVCSVRDLNGDGSNSTDTEGLDTQPQLIAQTAAPANGMSGRLKGDSSDDAIGRLTKNIKRPRSMTIPLSWSVIQ